MKRYWKRGGIGVRGDTTYNYIQNILGIREQQIFNIGCPSMRYFGVDFPKRKNRLPKFKKDSRIAVLFTSYGDPNELMSFYDRIWREYPNSVAIMQDHCEALLLKKGVPVPNQRVRPFLPSYNQHFMIQQGRCFIAPPNTRQWIDMLGDFDFVVGSRLHGGIAGVLSGTPTLIISLSDRQTEVAQYNRIPYIRSDMIRRETSLEALYEFSVENQGDIEKVYMENLKIYTDFLQKNGIPVNPDFLVKKAG